MNLPRIHYFEGVHRKAHLRRGVDRDTEELQRLGDSVRGGEGDPAQRPADRGCLLHAEPGRDGAALETEHRRRVIHRQLHVVRVLPADQ